MSGTLSEFDMEDWKLFLDFENPTQIYKKGDWAYFYLFCCQLSLKKEEKIKPQGGGDQGLNGQAIKRKTFF